MSEAALLPLLFLTSQGIFSGRLLRWIFWEAMLAIHFQHIFFLKKKFPLQWPQNSKASEHSS